MGQESSKPSRSQRYAQTSGLGGGGARGASQSRPLQKSFSKKYSLIPDPYKTLGQVEDSLAQAGLESSKLIVGLDFTKSNEWTGKASFQGRSLHALGSDPNPYEQAISIIGRTLAESDADNLIHCYGFGDGTTHDQHVFSFHPEDRPCDGTEEALTRYRAIVPHVKLAGPTSFAPIIDRAINIVEASGGQYHILLIVADGQVTRSVDMPANELSPQERATVDSIVTASNYPLSIILVGVGDGPWDMMREFDDNLPQRRFDNFQFVEFNRAMAKSNDPFVREAQFALAASMEIPSQYKAAVELRLLNHRTGKAPTSRALPPPSAVLKADAQSPPTPPADFVILPARGLSAAPPPGSMPQKAAEQNEQFPHLFDEENELKARAVDHNRRVDLLQDSGLGSTEATKSDAVGGSRPKPREDRPETQPLSPSHAVPYLSVRARLDGQEEYTVFSHGPAWSVIKSVSPVPLIEGIDSCMARLLAKDASYSDRMAAAVAICRQLEDWASADQTFDRLSSCLSQQLSSGAETPAVVLTAAALVQIAKQYGGLLNKLAESSDVSLAWGKVNPADGDYPYTLRFPTADQMAQAVGIGVEAAEVDLAISPLKARVRELPRDTAAYFHASLSSWDPEDGFQLLVALKVGAVAALAQRGPGAPENQKAIGEKGSRNPLETQTEPAFRVGAAAAVARRRFESLESGEGVGLNGGGRDPLEIQTESLPGSPPVQTLAQGPGGLFPGAVKWILGGLLPGADQSAPTGSATGQGPPIAGPAGAVTMGAASVDGGLVGDPALIVQINFDLRSATIKPTAPPPPHEQQAQVECTVEFEFRKFTLEAAKATGKLTVNVRPGEPRHDDFAFGYIQEQVEVKFGSSGAGMFADSKYNSRDDWKETDLALTKTRETSWGCGLGATKYFDVNHSRSGKSGSEEAQMEKVKHLEGFEIHNDSNGPRVGSKSVLRFVHGAREYSAMEPLVGSDKQLHNAYGSRMYQAKMEGAWQLKGAGTESFSIHVGQILVRDVKVAPPRKCLVCAQVKRPHESVSQQHNIEFKVLRNVLPLLRVGATIERELISEGEPSHRLFSWVN